MTKDNKNNESLESLQNKSSQTSSAESVNNNKKNSQISSSSSFTSNRFSKFFTSALAFLAGSSGVGAAPPRPTRQPTSAPPTQIPTNAFSPSEQPTFVPSKTPTKTPTGKPTTNNPTAIPSVETTSKAPSHLPSFEESLNPTMFPTSESYSPTSFPSLAPSKTPDSASPTIDESTYVPTTPPSFYDLTNTTNSPTTPPSLAPTTNTNSPTQKPSNQPSQDTIQPTTQPTNQPTSNSTKTDDDKEKGFDWSFSIDEKTLVIAASVLSFIALVSFRRHLLNCAKAISGSANDLLDSNKIDNQEDFLEIADDISDSSFEEAKELIERCESETIISSESTYPPYLKSNNSKAQYDEIRQNPSLSNCYDEVQSVLNAAFATAINLKSGKVKMNTPKTGKAFEDMANSTRSIPVFGGCFMALSCISSYYGDLERKERYNNLSNIVPILSPDMTSKFSENVARSFVISNKESINQLGVSNDLSQFRKDCEGISYHILEHILTGKVAGKNRNESIKDILENTKIKNPKAKQLSVNSSRNI